MSSEIDIQRLKNHWRKLIDGSKYRGKIDQLSVDIGRSEAYLRGLLLSPSIPKMDLLKSLSDALEISPNDLLQHQKSDEGEADSIADKIAEDIRKLVVKRLSDTSPDLTGKDVMQWWAAHGGRLENCDHILDRADIFELPDVQSGVVRTKRLGPKSLATRSLGTASDDLFQRTIAPLGKEFAHRILTAHKSSVDRGPMSSMETLEVAHPEKNARISIQYVRTLAPVTLTDGSTCVLNFSELLG